jgi:hypothetical protein
MPARAREVEYRIFPQKGLENKNIAMMEHHRKKKPSPYQYHILWEIHCQKGFYEHILL